MKFNCVTDNIYMLYQNRALHTNNKYNAICFILLQSIIAVEKDGAQKLQCVSDSCHLVLPNTSPKGKDHLREQTQKLRNDYEALFNKMHITKAELIDTLSQWQAVYESTAKLQTWLKNTEKSVEDLTCTMPTLLEKKEQVSRIKV